MRNNKTLFLFVFRSEYLVAQNPSDDSERKEALKSVFANVGWECSQILDEMEEVRDIYGIHPNLTIDCFITGPWQHYCKKQWYCNNATLLP